MLEAATFRIRSAVCVMLAAVLVLLSPGLACYSAAAAEFEGSAPKGAITPLPAVNAGLSHGVNIPGGLTTPELNIPGTQIPGAGLPVLPAAAIVPEILGAVPSGPGSTPQDAQPNVVPGTPAAEEAALAKLGQTLAPQIEAAGKTVNSDPRSSGERIEGLIEGRDLGSEAQSAVAQSQRTGSDVLPAAALPNPSGLYEHAYPIAVAKAAELGKKPSQVHFYEAAASVPGVDGASWKFSFYLTEKETSPEQLAKDKPKVGDIVYVDFNKAGPGSRGHVQISDDPSLDSYLRVYTAGLPAAPRSFAQTYDVPRVSLYRNAPLAADWVPFTSEPVYFKMGSQTSAQGALEAARRVGLAGGVSVSFKMAEEPATGAKDFWYRVYDNAGRTFVSNGRANESYILQPAKAPETGVQRLARYADIGKAVGLVAGLAAAAGIYHGVSGIDISSQYGLPAYIFGMLFSPLMMVLSAVGLAALGGKLGAWLSGVKTPKAAAAAAPAPAPVKPVEKKVVAAVPAKEPARRTNEQEGSVAGEWIGGLLTVGSALGGLAFVHTLTMAAPFAALMGALLFPFAGVALVLGGAAIGAALGRRMDRNGGRLDLPLPLKGALAAGATIASAFLLGVLAGVNPMSALLALSVIELSIGAGTLAAAAVNGRGRLDFKQDPLARFAGTTLISGALSGATFAALFGWLSYTIAGTLKDKPAQGGVAPLYAEAYTAATKAAAAKGYKPAQIQFAEAENQNPADPKAGWSFYFVARKDKGSAEGEVFRTYLYPQDQDGFRSNAYSYGQTKVSDGTPLLSLDGSKGLSLKAGLTSSLEKAAKALGTPAAGLALSMRPEGKDLLYVFENEAGARWGVNARTGKAQSLPASTVSVERIAAAVKSAVSYKGRPWSQTEYNMEQSMTENGLRRDGAGPAQIRLFYRLCGEAPVRPGGFNPWSGD